MEKKTISEINEIYDLELDKIVKTIKQKKAKKVLLQFPDGMKPYSTVIADCLSDLTNAEIMIWFESCYGACDIPLDVEKLGVDLIVQFGHSEWEF